MKLFENMLEKPCVEVQIDLGCMTDAMLSHKEMVDLAQKWAQESKSKQNGLEARERIRLNELVIMDPQITSQPNSANTPPPLPSVTNYPSHDGPPPKAAKSNTGAFISIISIVIACIGIIPAVIFVISFLPHLSANRGAGAGLGHVAFFFVGLIAHGIGVILGLVGFFMGAIGAKMFGLFGVLGNALILVIAIIGLFIGFAA